MFNSDTVDVYINNSKFNLDFDVEILQLSRIETEDTFNIRLYNFIGNITSLKVVINSIFVVLETNSFTVDVAYGDSFTSTTLKGNINNAEYFTKFLETEVLSKGELLSTYFVTNSTASLSSSYTFNKLDVLNKGYTALTYRLDSISKKEKWGRYYLGKGIVNFSFFKPQPIVITGVIDVRKDNLSLQVAKTILITCKYNPTLSIGDAYIDSLTTYYVTNIKLSYNYKGGFISEVTLTNNININNKDEQNENS